LLSSLQLGHVSDRQESRLGHWCVDASTAFILARAERALSDDFDWPKELDTLKLSIMAKAADFLLQGAKTSRRF
jgi:hypothetical protein